MNPNTYKHWTRKIDWNCDATPKIILTSTNCNRDNTAVFAKHRTATEPWIQKCRNTNLAPFLIER